MAKKNKKKQKKKKKMEKMKKMKKIRMRKGVEVNKLERRREKQL